MMLESTLNFYLTCSMNPFKVKGPLTSILSQVVNLGGMALTGPINTSS